MGAFRSAVLSVAVASYVIWGISFWENDVHLPSAAPETCRLWVTFSASTLVHESLPTGSRCCSLYRLLCVPCPIIIPACAASCESGSGSTGLLSRAIRVSVKRKPFPTGALSDTRAKHVSSVDSCVNGAFFCYLECMHNRRALVRDKVLREQKAVHCEIFPGKGTGAFVVHEACGGRGSRNAGTSCGGGAMRRVM